jgi:hypothetical protein
VESDRFDDVDFRMIEAPSPGPPRRGRRGLIAVAAVLATCGLGLGGSAFADSRESAAPAAKPHFGHHGGCHHWQGSSSVRY